MATFTMSSTMDVPAHVLFDWHARPGAFERLSPPWNTTTLIQHEGIRDGAQAVIQLHQGPFRIRWVARHQVYEDGVQFQDQQLRGPFRQWLHTHRTEHQSDTNSTLVDHIQYALPFHALSFPLVGHRVENELHRTFAYRHQITKTDLIMHQQYNPSHIPLRVAISGASGLLGRALTALLQSGGHTVCPLVRKKSDDTDAIYWNIAKGEIEQDKLEGLDAVIHLAGENVFALRWTAEKKDRIMRSRAEGTRLLCEALARCARPPQTLLAASGIGIYGERGNTRLTEADTLDDNSFLARVCQAWEGATMPAKEAGIRTVNMRIGVVLTPQGGALQQMLTPFRLGIGGRLGPAGQYFSWIALDDVLKAIYHLLFTPSCTGPINLVAPHPVTMGTLAKTLGSVLKRPSLLPAPTPLLRLLMGEVADEILLTGARVHPEKLLDSDYVFAYPELEPALRHMLGRPL